MQRRAYILAGLLGVQLALALALSLGGPDHASFQAKEPLLAFDPAAVDRIDIDESGANSVTLTEQDGNWAIPPMAGFPADGQRVAAFLGALAGLKKGWAAATSADAAQRFKVAEDGHERRIILRKGDKTLAELLLGASPSFREVYARAGSAPDIYSIAFSTYDVGTRGEEWMKRDVLSVSDDKVAGLTIGDVKIARKDGRYVLADLASGETQNDSAVWKVAGASVHPVFDAVQGKGPDALAKVSEPDIQVSIKTTDGGEVLLKYKKEAAGGAYLLSSSASDYLFRVSEAAVEPLAKAKRETLLEAKHDGKGAEAAGQHENAARSNGG